MRIRSRVPVSGKMFGGCDHAAALRAFDKSCDKPGHVGRIFAVRTHIDNRVRSVVVHISYRRVNLLHTHRPRFTRCQFALAPRVIRIPRRSDGHVPWKIDGVVKAHARTRFQVGRNQEWVLCQLLHAINEYDRFVHRPAKQNDAPDMVIDDLMTQGLERLAVLVQKRRVNGGANQLANLFIERHFPEFFVGPRQCIFRWPRRIGLDPLIEVRGRRWVRQIGCIWFEQGRKH